MQRIAIGTIGALVVAAISAQFAGGTPALAQTSANEPISKTCRVGPRSREVDIQII